MANHVCALTGANGYVGSSIRRALERNGWRVVPLVRRAEREGISWALESSAGVGREMCARGVSALVHAAWDMRCVRPADYFRINLDGSRRLLDEAAGTGIRNIVFISSISAFDQAVSLYGRTKLDAEKSVARVKGLSIRPGLVWGETPGGVFGAIEKTVRSAKMVPLIGDGSYPQYLVHEDDLGDAVVRALAENWRESVQRPITIANPSGWRFRDLVLSCAARAGRSVKLISLPWRVVYSGLKTTEALGLPLSFRSDSVLSLVNQNPEPDFSAIDRFHILVRAYPNGTSTAQITG